MRPTAISGPCVQCSGTPLVLPTSSPHLASQGNLSLNLSTFLHPCSCPYLALLPLGFQILNQPSSALSLLVPALALRIKPIL
jgi:hypothetical protein